MKTGIQYLDEQRTAIQKGLLENQNYIHQQKELHNGDIAFLAELFLEELLNAIYANEGWKIKNLNTYKPNHPAIDLADKKNRVCFQITVTDSTGNANKKIKDTLTSFYKRGLDKDYDRLFIVFASGIQNKKGIKIPPTVEVNGHNVPVAGSLITNESVNDLLDLEETIFEGTRDSEKIKNVLIKIPARPEQKLPVFKAEKYIARKALDLEGRSIDLTNYLNKEKRVVLLGVGGWGKTTELIRITNEIKKTANTFCFFVRLINYSRSLETLLNARCKNWQNVPEDAETYFILDGFDEIDSSKIEEAGHEIENFAAGHSDAHLLVSCRNNFNPFHAIENPDEKKSDEFNVCYLEELSDEDIQKYIEQECLDSASFMSAVKENKSFEILSNPYYLVNTIDIYNSTGRLPETKAAFFDKLIELRIDWERDKKPLTWQNIDEYGLRESLRNLALTMQYAGSFKISQRDFTMIVRKQEIRQTIQKLFFLSGRK
ncbi:SMEK domain-containing protein [Prolixibacter bellariivorans]|uniref:SMEK domain-containing protein n=1 Tax=Prolixibacter bellariivorans TaxID=314319 RepID=UPI00046E5455|nr:SMEK domain-containing protein [Prolixibacter bellariivorans]